MAVFALERFFYLFLFSVKIDNRTDGINKVFFEMKFMAIRTGNEALMGSVVDQTTGSTYFRVMII